MSKILVIDDDPTIRLILKRALETAGYDVAVAMDGVDGIRQAQKLHPELIICDWMMPLKNGLEVCQYIKKLPGLSLSYFILLTTRQDVDDRVQALDIGADEFLQKPIDIQELQARVRAGLRLQKLTQELQAANHQLKARNELLESLSLSDQLTGLLNRRAMEQTLPNLVQQIGSYHTHSLYNYLSLVILELDYLSEINDTYGESVGNILLQVTAKRLKANSIISSSLYRYAGEKFVCITPGLNPTDSSSYAESLRLAIANNPIQISPELLIPITVSIGCAIISQGNLVGAQELWQQASQALYNAKREGRNCVRFSLASRRA